jgi:hypothetical protein
MAFVALPLPSDSGQATIVRAKLGLPTNLGDATRLVRRRRLTLGRETPCAASDRVDDGCQLGGAGHARRAQAGGNHHSVGRPAREGGIQPRPRRPAPGCGSSPTTTPAAAGCARPDTTPNRERITIGRSRPCPTRRLGTSAPCDEPGADSSPSGTTPSPGTTPRTTRAAHRDARRPLVRGSHPEPRSSARKPRSAFRGL